MTAPLTSDAVREVVCAQIKNVGLVASNYRMLGATEWGEAEEGAEAAILAAVAASRAQDAERVEQLLTTLSAIADPLTHVIRKVRADGMKLDAQRAIRLANSPRYLSELARDALAAYRAAGPTTPDLHGVGGAGGEAHERA